MVSARDLVCSTIKLSSEVRLSQNGKQAGSPTCISYLFSPKTKEAGSKFSAVRVGQGGDGQHNHAQTWEKAMIFPANRTSGSLGERLQHCRLRPRGRTSWEENAQVVRKSAVAGKTALATCHQVMLYQS